jgi:hypothetical protein
VKDIDYLVYSGPVKNDCICDDEVKVIFEIPTTGYLPHALSDRLACIEMKIWETLEGITDLRRI